MANKYLNLPLRQLYAELANEHDKFLKSMKYAQPNEMKKQIAGNVRAILRALHKRIGAFPRINEVVPG
jgi:hypothetical protein